jgi:septum formation protein
VVSDNLFGAPRTENRHFPMKLLLASHSPRRAELLRNAGFDFELIASGLKEGPPGSGETPEDYARRLAREKALGGAANVPEGSLVLGADTIVTLNGSILGKPLGPFDAARMIRMLSGMTHQVVTAICLVKAPNEIAALKHETTFVTFREVSVDEIHDYIANKEPYDKAGSYAIQGLASRFVTRISGCYFNVVGLPIALLDEVLKGLEAASAKPKAGGQDSTQPAQSPVKG